MVQDQIAAGGQVAGVTREQRWVLGLASLASFIVILDVMVVATALTAIRRHLGASLADLEWTVSAYTLSFAVLLMTAAALGDRLGRRRVFAAGLIIFAVSSAGCALAPDAAALIAARAVQGAGAATIMPMALALLNGAFPPARRGWAIGIYGGVTALAAVAGPVLGGAVTQGLGWQWIFWLNVPVALAAVPLVLSRISEATGPGAAVDLPGLVLVSTAALGLVWGLVRGNTAGWGSFEVIGTLAGGAAAAAAFAAWERRAAGPMLPARLFRSPAFSAGNTAIFMINASLTGVIFLMPQFQQVVAGQDPLGSGLRLLPWGIAPFLVGPRAGALADRVGERVLVVTGSLLQAAGVAWIAAAAGPGTGYLALVTPMIIIGVGFALAIPAVTRSVTSTVPPADIGTASAAFTTMRQLGGAFGVAVLGAVFAATGSYATPAAFSHGFTMAFAVAAGLALAGTAAGARLTGREPPVSGPPEPGTVAAAASQAPGTSTTARFELWSYSEIRTLLAVRAVPDILSQGGGREPGPWPRRTAAAAALALVAVLIVYYLPRSGHGTAGPAHAARPSATATPRPPAVSGAFYGDDGITGRVLSWPGDLRLPAAGQRPVWFWPATGQVEPIDGLPAQRSGYQFIRAAGGWAVQAGLGSPAACGNCAGPRRAVYFVADRAGPATRAGLADAVAPGAAGTLWLTSYPAGADPRTAAGMAWEVSTAGRQLGPRRRLPAGYLIVQGTGRGLLLAPVAPRPGMTADKLWEPATQRASRGFDAVIAASATQIAWVPPCAARCRVQVLNVDTGRQAPVELPEATSVASGAFSPDGRFLALQVSSGDNSDDGQLAVQLDLVSTASDRLTVVPRTWVSSDALAGFGWPAGSDTLVAELSFTTKVQLASWHAGASQLAIAALTPRHRPASLVIGQYAPLSCSGTAF